MGVSKRICIDVVGSGDNVLAGLGRLEEPPYLLGIMFAFISPAMRALPLARLLGRIEERRWLQDRIFFIPNVRQGDLTGECAGVVSSASVSGGSDVGDLTMARVCQGKMVIRIQFVMAWRRQFRGRNSQFLPAACALELTGPAADRKRPGGVPAPFVRTPRLRRLGPLGQLPVELKSILDGKYCISKAEQTLLPIFRRNLASWEDNAEAQEALWPVVAKMLFKEYWNILQGIVNCRCASWPWVQ